MALDSAEVLVRGDDAPAELSAPQAGTPATAPILPPAEQPAVPPEGFTANGDPDLSEEGLAREAAAAEAAKAEKAEKPAKTPKVKAEAKPAAQEPDPVEAAPEAEPEAAAPPEPEAPKPEEPAPGKLATQLRAREKRLVQQQQTFARERSEFENYKKTTEAQFTAFRADAERHQQVVAMANKVVELAQQSPIQLLRNLGWTDEQIGQRLLNGDKPSSEEAATRLERQLAEMQAKYDRELAAEREARAAEKAERARLEQESRVETEIKQFVATSRADADRWPLASRYSEAKLRARGMAIAEENVRAGHHLSNEEILDKLEEELSEVASLAPKATGRSASVAAQPAPSAKPKTSPQVQSGANRSQPAPTLTSAAAGERSVDVDSFDPLLASEEDLLAATLREIEVEKARRGVNGAARK